LSASVSSVTVDISAATCGWSTPRNHFLTAIFILHRDPVLLYSVLVQIMVADGCCSDSEKPSLGPSSILVAGVPFQFELVDSCGLRALIDLTARSFQSLSLDSIFGAVRFPRRQWILASSCAQLPPSPPRFLCVSFSFCRRVLLPKTEFSR
jgi:hypothetical protein